MGHKDTVALHKIYDILKEYCEKYKVPYSFKVDDGDYETAIQFKEVAIDEVYCVHPPYSEDWESNPEIKCPDILDYDNKIIIEYEEEGCKKRPGASLATKGHGFEGDMPTKKDTERNRLYKLCGFHFLRFYETDLKEENWEKLYDFILQCMSCHTDVQDVKNT